MKKSNAVAHEIMLKKRLIAIRMTSLNCCPLSDNELLHLKSNKNTGSDQKEMSFYHTARARITFSDEI